jgi:hypothetical protein
MIIDTKFSSSVARRSALATNWALAMVCGAFVTACSGTIDTPTEEFPPRQGNRNSASTNNSPAASSAQSAAPRPAPSAPANDDDDAPAAPAPAAPDPADDATPAAAEPADEEPVAASGDLSFEADVWPIFNAKCGPTCHVSDGFGGQNIGSEDLEEALADAVDREDRVLSDLETGRMPLGCGSPPGGGGTCVTEEEFDTIEAWYEAGAPE